MCLRKLPLHSESIFFFYKFFEMLLYVLVCVYFILKAVIELLVCARHCPGYQGLPLSPPPFITVKNTQGSVLSAVFQESQSIPVCALKGIKWVLYCTHICTRGRPIGLAFQHPTLPVEIGITLTYNRDVVLANCSYFSTFALHLQKACGRKIRRK